MFKLHLRRFADVSPEMYSLPKRNQAVIPVKLAIASASRNPPPLRLPLLAKGEIQWGFWIPAFAGKTDEVL